MLGNEQKLCLHADEQISYILRCSDCEAVSEEYFSRQQAAHLCNKDGWKDVSFRIGSRIVCPKCAVNYQSAPTARESVKDSESKE